eukprot:jgi/Psemu1/296271/fgenesh1_pm.139_\
MAIQQPSSRFLKGKDAISIFQLIIFTTGTKSLSTTIFSSSESDTATTSPSVDSVEEASRILSEWDRMFNPESVGQEETDAESTAKHRNSLEACVRFLAEAAADERNQDSTMGRCMLGICASSAEEGVATLKAWVSALELPRGLLHGMDKDGVPIDLSGGVYIKYNSGGVYTFADIRRSGLGFDALWKPGDALLETYDGTYRGVYFQVELEDDEFRQYLVPLDVF